MQKNAILCSGFISEFYTSSILGQRSKDQVVIVASRSEANTKKFADKFKIPDYSTDLKEAINHFLRTGFDMFTVPGQSGYVAEKAESDSGWIFPVVDENQYLGYNHMFSAFENKTEPIETFYDGYVVNVIMEVAYTSVKSKKWEPIRLKVWRGDEPNTESAHTLADYNEQYYLLKEEVMPDGGKKLLLKDKSRGR